ncbi:hypothetical protein FOZ60_015825 [Perkinsus olseni]|uniref:GMP phosphodiesterase delta subunit domain-containing protein n=1 Tax=Perkinsus olseni TaxID=32597 RepID=A0A7J6P5B7_PEROL|nr:hypothetical protein FOZ60_015825 [Perkinsus olseni]
MEPTSAESETQQPRESAEAPDTGCLTGWEWITPEVVTKFSCATDEFLCPASANTYGIDFLGFTVRDVDSGVKLLEITKDPPNPGASSSSSVPKPEEDTQQRSIRYHFGPEFLDLRNIGTKLEFSVGEKPIRNFRMIERHYYKDKILKSYDFAMPYCIPNTVNTWEVIYELPELTDEQKRELIDNPWETKSDSFYFVDDILVMHHKADYSYADEME